MLTNHSHVADETNRGHVDGVVAQHLVGEHDIEWIKWIGKGKFLGGITFRSG